MPAAGVQLGRYRLAGRLGEGAQATVWHARDTRLERDVALKLFKADAAAPAAGAPLAHWLQEARAVSRLAHPHIVPVFDAELIDGHACLVFELVRGSTLAALLRQRGAWPAREAVELMLGVVDALRAAHAQSIVHRDLKPSNILLDDGGRARVMDFGIAAWLDAGTAGRAPLAAGAPHDPYAGCIVGTPGYLSPEAAAAAPASEQMDVFAAGLVLAELLTGQRLVGEREPQAALRRVRADDLQLPAAAACDDRLRAIVQRAIARRPAERWDSAASLRDALMQWLAPADDAAATSGHGTLDFLLRRMRHKSDFPALSGHVLRIQRLAASDSDPLQTLADEILKDVALSQKLLRLVNTAQYRRGAHGVATVSRAVALVGLAGIRNLALSLVLVEHMKDKAHAQRLKEEFLRALLAAQLAQALAGGTRDAEEAFLGAMFHRLGRLLTEYYFPDEADAIRSQAALAPAASGPDQAPDWPQERAARMVLGLSFEDLGIGVARHWGLPESLQRCMRRPEGPPRAQAPADGPERQRRLAVMANDVADAVWSAGPGELPARLDQLAERQGRALGVGAPDLLRAAAAACTSAREMALAMGLALPPGSRAWQVLEQLPARRGDRAVAARDAALAGVVDADAATLQLAPALAPPAGATAPAGHGAPALPPGAPAAVGDLLAAGIQDITDTLSADSFRLNEVLQMVLETMYRALGLQRIVFCLRDAASGRLLGRFGLGDRAAALCPVFQVPLQWPAHETPDLFGAVCRQGSDTWIADARAPAIAHRLPLWYRRQVDAASFLLLPLQMKQAPFALIYADADRTGALQIGAREQALLRTLRNQAVLAFRQAAPQA